jgi:hypothetical protein
VAAEGEKERRGAEVGVEQGGPHRRRRRRDRGREMGFFPVHGVHSTVKASVPTLWYHRAGGIGAL